MPAVPGTLGDYSRLVSTTAGIDGPTNDLMHHTIRSAFVRWFTRLLEREAVVRWDVFGCFSCHDVPCGSIFAVVVLTVLLYSTY
jgi:hypothetical protein